MKKDSMVKINIFICVIIALGFLITSFISYNSNKGIFFKDIENISTLTLEGIYHEIDNILSKPINISMTMANDSLLKNLLEEEDLRSNDEEFLSAMKNYLNTYKEKYGYESVFLVSTNTNRYYHFNGIDRILTPDNAENDWYYAFISAPEEYSINIDNDEAANNEITVFVNCKMKNDNDEIIGVIGVGFNVNHLQQMFVNYEKQFNVLAYLIDNKGIIQMSVSDTGYSNKNFFDYKKFFEVKNDIFSKKDDMQRLWHSFDKGESYIASQYIPVLDWYLIIDNDVTELEKEISLQMFKSVLVILVVIAIILSVITNTIRNYDREIVKLATERERKHKTKFQNETEKLYENIYEINISKNEAASEDTEAYFESLGVPRNTPYNEALRIIADKQIKEEFKEGYVSTFEPKNILKVFKEGKESISYDFMITKDSGISYYWMRITACIFYWDDDKSVRMFVYRQNVDDEKSKEKQMIDKMERDSLTGLFNKVATQKAVQKKLSNNTDKLYAFFILDIDNFKNVNDSFGHAVGDHVIVDFAHSLQKCFRDSDIIGRIGGDEFAAFCSVDSLDTVRSKACKISDNLNKSFRYGDIQCDISASIGIAVSPINGTDFDTIYKNADIALYETKKKGKNGFTIYRDN